MSGALPAGWAHVTLGELAAPEQGAMTDGPFGSNLTSAHYTGAGARVIRLENIGNGEFRDHRSYISEEHFDRLRKHEVLPGDLVVASLGDNLPRACLLPELEAPALVKADCIRVRLGDRVLPRLVLYALQAPVAKRWASERLKGVGRQRLGMAGIRALPLPLPPLGEQQRIVAVLEDCLSRLDAGLSYLGASDRRVRTWRQRSRDSQLLLGAVGECRLADLVERIEAGRSFGGAAPPAGPDEWGVLRVSAMTWGEFRPEENKSVPAAAVDRRWEVRKGDVLVSRANTSEYVGAPVLVPDVRPRLLLSDKSLRLVPASGVDPAWLVEALASSSARQQITALASGTKESMRNVSQANLLSLRLPLADPAGQRAVLEGAEAARDSAARLCAELQSARRRAASLRRALLTAAFSGRL